MTTRPGSPSPIQGVALAGLLFAGCAGCSTVSPRQGVPVIFDTDIGTDVDDAGALALLHILADRGEATILATMSANRGRWSAPAIDVINTFYGRGDLPIGSSRTGPDDERWYHQAVPLFPHDLTDGRAAPEAVALYRTILAAQPDHSVTIVVVGWLTNMAGLLASSPDGSSPLDGKALVADKVKELVVMGGSWPNNENEGEYNFHMDGPAAHKVVSDWPGRIMFTGLGKDVMTGARLMAEETNDHPVRAFYSEFLEANDVSARSSWDLIAVLYAVRGPGDCFSAVAGGRCVTQPDGGNEWVPDPAANHGYLALRVPPEELARRIDDLLVTPPARSAPSSDDVLEPARRIPVAYDADVVVAGGGFSGIAAALAAARQGARTVLIERQGTVGGSFGPGMHFQSIFLRDDPDRFVKGAPYDYVKGEVGGLTREFAERFFALHGGRESCSLAESHLCSYVTLEMLREAGVRVMLCSHACDAIMEGGKVRGVFVENKSGRQAVKAKVVIDATGEADICRRAGAPVLKPEESYHEYDSHAPTGIGLWAMVAGLDGERIDGDKVREITWKEDIGGLAEVTCDGLREVAPDPTLRAIKVQLVRPHPKVDAGDAGHMSTLEAGIRTYCIEFVERCRKHVPGCENAYLLHMAPYLCARGGPCIEGEYTLTMPECYEGKRFDDVIYVYGEAHALRWQAERKVPFAWTDVPYRVMIPKEVDGLIAVGRSASCIPDTLLRICESVICMGQAGGTAAAMCARSGIEPRHLDVKELQKKLLSDGFYLGDEERVASLGLGR
ncbi:MAG: FAD-dependent oxidoreductase [Planctomycetes bacterium]|nr:FAD-dependent oxidoreductase [Planctomycetota bacterium]